MRMGFWLGRAAFRAAKNRKVTPHGPQWVVPYRGRYRKTYHVTKLVTILLPLTALAFLIIKLALAVH